MNLARFLAWSLLMVSALLCSPNVPAQAVATLREVTEAAAGWFTAGRVRRS